MTTEIPLPVGKRSLEVAAHLKRDDGLLPMSIVHIQTLCTRKRIAVRRPCDFAGGCAYAPGGWSLASWIGFALPIAALAFFSTELLHPKSAAP
jgi:hypothetical protein